MMKPIIFTAAFVFVSAVAGEAMAASCSGTQITDSLGTNETATVTFSGVTNNKTVTVAGLTLTGSTSLYNTAAAVATAFSGKLDGIAPGGNFSGSLSGWNAGTSSGASVTFTSSTTGNVTPNISTGGTSPPSSVSTTDGTTGAGVTLSTLLTGNSMCQTANEIAQEQHVSGGVLQDYKKGPVSTSDKTTQIGTWLISGTGVNTIVRYTYGSTSYDYNVFLASGTAGASGSTYEFCTSGTLKATATYRPGFGNTGSYAPVCP